MIVNSGIKKVIFSGEYPDKETFKLFKLAGVKIQKLEPKN
jgi:deoxycytidylate deaminase